MAKIQVQGIGVYDDKTLKKKIIQLASDLQKNAKKGDWNKASENGIRALGRMWQAYQDWSRQNESINEGPDADLGKKLKQIQNQIYKLGHQYKSKANVPAMMRSFMLGVQNQLKKDKLTEGPQRDMNVLADYIIDLNIELSNAKILAKKHPKYKKYIKFIQQDIKDAENKLKKIKDKLR